MKDRKPEKKKKSPRTELKEDISEEKKHKRKRKDSDDSTQTTPGDDSVAPPARKEEKRKKRKRVAEAEKETKEKEEPVAKKRKHRNKTGLPDPEEDESLTEQSQKALSYAFLQFYRPKKWKFNKARQNWIIRNLWSVEAVPDVYQPLILKYMSHVQGGVRENLIKTCRSILDEQKPVPVPDTNIAPAVGGVLVESDTSAPLTDVKVSRAKVLLATLTKTES
ncbi:hypothetical protein BDQ17DRAFT_1348836 [Cyathus striatus]|nr:hypothetical protein BDQ17DRAFT_1348836 [Cyathus striatus]